MEGLIWVVGLCLLAVSTDVVDWITDRIGAFFNEKDK
jgi:hypothetical protein|tara:strand:- start:1319 stop:1429 length:111 start_codon:yes stop_codon:yes gene_type:complete